MSVVKWSVGASLLQGGEVGAGEITSPPFFRNHLTPSFESILVQGVGGVHKVEQNVVEEGLECGYRGSFHPKKTGKGVCRGDA